MKSWWEGVLNLANLDYEEGLYGGDIEDCRDGAPSFPTLINEDEFVVQITAPDPSDDPYLYIYFLRSE